MVAGEGKIITGRYQLLTSTQQKEKFTHRFLTKNNMMLEMTTTDSLDIFKNLIKDYIYYLGDH